MFSDDEIKDIPESNFMRPGDEIISIREVCLSDKFVKKELGLQEPLLSNSVRNEIDSRSLFRDSFFTDSLEPNQARFAWTEEDGNIAALVSESGFGTTGQTTFGKDLEAAFHSELKEADTSSSMFSKQLNTSKRYNVTFATKSADEVSSTSAGPSGSSFSFERKSSQGTCKVDKTDPRSRFHYVKYVKRAGRTVKLWECGICGREFQHQYTLMRHLPTHTDERNFHCDACGKSFRQLSTLSQHRAIHSADRPYACEVCNKTFNRVSTLISHRKTHSNEKPYRCHMCPKGFHQKGNLRNHLFTHTNERPYRCNICFKGFNQQSNLVCHKNKAHPEDDCGNLVAPRKPPKMTRAPTEVKSEKNRAQQDQCEVTSSVEPHLCSVEVSSFWLKSSRESPETLGLWSNDNPSHNHGVIVDSINTFHMGVALATKQTPFALLKPENGVPVLVKVVDMKLPNGKQMLVPATAEDLRTGGKIVVKNENDIPEKEVDVETNPQVAGAVQIRVPVVATVVPKIQAGGRLHLKVEEPHHAYHSTISSDAGEVNIQSCLSKPVLRSPPPLIRAEPSCIQPAGTYDENNLRPGGRISSTCALPPPAPSPPLDLVTLDLFEPMECIPMGPQITPVNIIDRPPPSDDSDIFIGEFEESIALSDSD